MPSLCHAFRPDWSLPVAFYELLAPQAVLRDGALRYNLFSRAPSQSALRQNALGIAD